LLPTLRRALAEDGVSIIACPVDYAENMQLTDRLGQLTMALGRVTGADAATPSSRWSVGSSLRCRHTDTMST